MSNETESREAFEKVFKKTEYYQSQKQLRLVEGDWPETYIEQLVESHYKTWQARDAEVNELRDGREANKAIINSICGEPVDTNEVLTVRALLAERDELRKEVERLKGDFEKAVDLLGSQEQSFLFDQIKAAKEAKE